MHKQRGLDLTTEECEAKGGGRLIFLRLVCRSARSWRPIYYPLSGLYFQRERERERAMFDHHACLTNRVFRFKSPPPSRAPTFMKSSMTRVKISNTHCHNNIPAVACVRNKPNPPVPCFPFYAPVPLQTPRPFFAAAAVVNRAVPRVGVSFGRTRKDGCPIHGSVWAVAKRR